MSFTIICGVPLISANTCRASSWACTVGTRTARVERTESMVPIFVCRTSCYTNNKALKAWFWVETATSPLTARSLRNASILGSAGTISARPFIL